MEYNLPFRNMVAKVIPIPNEHFQFLKLCFEDTLHYFVRLIGQSSMIGILKLYSLKLLNMTLILDQPYTQKDLTVVIFFRIHWK